MANYYKFDLEAVKYLSTHNNMEVARLVIPDGSEKELENARKHVSLLRKNIGVIEACEGLSVDPTTTPMLWLKNKEASVRVTNPLFIKPEEKSFNNLTETLIADLQNYAQNLQS